MSSGDTNTSTHTLDLLTLPGVATLTDDQTRGAVCVWDRTEAPLTAETAIDLGEAMSPHGDGGPLMRWFPRGCRTCTTAYALRALHDHAPFCEECVENVAECETGVALLRLMREARG